MATNEEMMAAMLADQERRRKESLEKMKKSVGKPPEESAVKFGSGATRVHYVVDPRDIKPSPYGRSAEDVLDEVEGERRRDYDLIKGRK